MHFLSVLKNHIKTFWTARISDFYLYILFIFFSYFRHNLTLNKAFIKVPRPATEGRGAYWKLEAGAEAQIFRRMARNYNRPKPVSFARQNIYYCDTTDINTVFITVPTWCMSTIWGLGSPRAPLGSVVGPPETLPPIQSVQQSFIFVLVFWRISSKNKDNKKKIQSLYWSKFYCLGSQYNY